MGNFLNVNWLDFCSSCLNASELQYIYSKNLSPNFKGLLTTAIQASHFKRCKRFTCESNPNLGYCKNLLIGLAYSLLKLPTVISRITFKFLTLTFKVLQNSFNTHICFTVTEYSIYISAFLTLYLPRISSPTFLHTEILAFHLVNPSTLFCTTHPPFGLVFYCLHMQRSFFLN